MQIVRFSAIPLVLISASALSAPASAQLYTTVAQPQSDADALAAAIRTLGANPQNLDALITAGELSLRVGDASGAAALFARAEKVDPRNGRVKAGMAAILVHEERPGEALRYYDQAVGFGLDPARFAAERGLAYDLIGEPDRAQRDYRLALRTGGANDEVTRRYALSLGISGKQEPALQALDPLLRKSDRGAWRARAFILAMTGDVGGAGRIATSMMPPGMAQGLQPFFARLPTLSAADRAFAVHFGEVRPTPERLADARMTPALPTLGIDPTAPVQVAATPVAQPVQVASKDDRKSRRTRGRKDRIEAVRVAQAAPIPAAATLPQPPAYGTRAAGGTVFAAARPVVQALPGAAATPVGAGPSVSPPIQVPIPIARAPVQLASAGMDRLPTGASGGLTAPRPRQVRRAVAQPATPPTPATALPAPVTTPPTPATALPPPVTAAPAPAAVASSTPAPAAPQGLGTALATVPGAAIAQVAAASGGATARTTLATPATAPVNAVAARSPAPATIPGSPANAVATQVSAAAPSSDAALRPSGAFQNAPVGVAGPGQNPASAPVRSVVPGPAATTSLPAVAAASPTPPRMGEDSILAKIIAGISIPQSELNAAAAASSASTQMAATRPAAVAARGSSAPVATAVGPSAEDLAATRAKAAADRKALARKKADADKKALADKKAAAEKKKLADEKAAAEKLAKADPPRIWVQVAGGANEDDLPKAWSAAKDKAKALSGKSAYSTPLRATNRVVTGPFKTDAEARAFVNTLAKQGVSGFTFTSEKGQKMTRLGGK